MNLAERLGYKSLDRMGKDLTLGEYNQWLGLRYAEIELEDEAKQKADEDAYFKQQQEAVSRSNAY